MIRKNSIYILVFILSVLLINDIRENDFDYHVIVAHGLHYVLCYFSSLKISEPAVDLIVIKHALDLTIHFPSLLYICILFVCINIIYLTIFLTFLKTNITLIFERLPRLTFYKRHSSNIKAFIKIP